MFFPELGDLDGLVLLVLPVGGHTLLVGVVEYLLQVVGLERVQDVVEVLARRASAFGIHSREELHELAVLLQVRPQRLHGELVVVKHRDVVHLLLLQQLLLANEHVFEEVLVHGCFIRYVLLH